MLPCDSERLFSAGKTLKVIRLNKNQIESLPGRIGDLKRLVEISIDYNVLRGLPFSFYNLTRLKILRVEVFLFFGVILIFSVLIGYPFFPARCSGQSDNIPSCRYRFQRCRVRNRLVQEAVFAG